ncbi:AAA family ATPase [Parageobacillus sp. G301]|uniref:McrB family protein n=1 Tax=Parageobacillus sp. G301 TaxID=2998290 RepID=UPI00249812C5|nr:AAA family ATPase [Parageobacillus sp. G301]GLH65314.1 hypothetical protein PG301_31530 [Parageobacillus sp. G301]
MTEITEDKELLSYVDSFQDMQNFLLNEENIIDIDVIEKVILFIREGTKNRRKKNFKTYFENIEMNIDTIKGWVNILEKLKDAIKNEEIGSIKDLKNHLISQGILKFNQKYLDTFSISGRQKYLNWLNNQIGDLKNKLLEAYRNNSLNSELVGEFVTEFKKYLNGRLLLKIVSIDTKQIIGVPIHLNKNGDVEMLPHPFLDSEWELSRSIDTLKDKERIKVGDIVAAYFTDNKSERYIHTLLYVDFDGAEILPQTLQQALSEFVDNEYIEQYMEKIRKIFGIDDKNGEQIATLIMQKLLDINSDIRQKLLEERDEIRKEKEKLLMEEKELDEKRREWYRIMKKIDEMIEIEEQTTPNKNETYTVIEYEPEQFISHLQSLFYYNDDQHLIYKEEIIKTFIYSLQANILTLLAGPSGTGKSSIVQALGRAVENVEVRMIPVQSSWTDTQDLLGYFHPIDKTFVPTPFMEALAEAAQKQNQSKLFLICLDEMNLAHIEYYFSEILSAREQKTPALNLYPKRYLEIAKLILSDERSSVEQRKSAEELIRLYPPVFKIPENVRFIGTLNMDHTVKPLSPKVIDRSFIIEVGHLKSDEKEKIKEKLKPLTGKIKMDYETFTSPFLDDTAVNDAVEKIKKISNLLEDYPNASLNSRGIKHVRNFLKYAKNKEEQEELIDCIILGKILPRIEIKRSEFDKISNKVLNELSPYSRSYQRLKVMLEAKHTVTFW